MYKNGKLFGKINIIDLIVLLLVLVFVIGMAIRVGGTKTGEITNKVEFEYVVKVENVRDFTIKALEKKGDVFEDTNNVKVGEITDVSVEPYKGEGVKSNGTRVFAEIPGRYTAYVTVKCEGTCVDGVYYDAVKTDIGTGRGQKICTENVATNGAIISIKGSKEEA